MTYQVFFSHSGRDSQWAKWIAHAAQNAGLEVYLFEHDSQPGRQISDKIKHAILQSDALVVLLTPSGQASAYVQQEIGFAEARSKIVIPLVWPGCQKPKLALLEGREYIEFSPHNPNLDSLLAYLQRLKGEKERNALLAIGALVFTALILSAR